VKFYVMQCETLRWILGSCNSRQIHSESESESTYKLNFSFQIGLSSLGTVFVLFLVLPTWTVTYGSLVPVLSLAISPWAQITTTIKHTQYHCSQSNADVDTPETCFNQTYRPLQFCNRKKHPRKYHSVMLNLISRRNMLTKMPESKKILSTLKEVWAYCAGFVWHLSILMNDFFLHLWTK